MSLGAQDPTVDPRFHDRQLSVFDPNMGLPRHRWYHFRQGFSRDLVSQALDSIPQPTPGRVPLVLDPFAGVGTTLLTAAARGWRGLGVEVNPFLAFAVRAKTTPGPWNAADFRRACDRVMGASPAHGLSRLERFSTFSKRGGASKWLFDLDGLRQFQACRRELSRVPPLLHEPLLLALIASALDCSNVKRDGKCLRYRPGWQESELDGEAFLRTFSSRCAVLQEDVEALPLGMQGARRVLLGDARKILPHLGPPASVDLVVTSPPYLNSLDYSDVYRPELFLGRFVGSNSELRDLRMRTVRSHVQVSWSRYAAYRPDPVVSIAQRISAVGNLWDRRIPDMVLAYFSDMYRVLAQVARLLRPGAQAWIVVGTSAYGGIEIPVDMLIAKAGEAAGLSVKGVYLLRSLRSSGQHWRSLGNAPPLRESLLVLGKGNEPL